MGKHIKLKLKLELEPQSGVAFMAAMQGQGEPRVFSRNHIYFDKPVINDKVPIGAGLGTNSGTLLPLFQVVIERKRWSMNFEGARIEVALDTGEIVHNDKRIPLCDVQLKLTDGPAATLFSLARKLGETTRLRPCGLSKAERGYLLTGSAGRAVKIEPVVLDPEMSVVEAFDRIADACLRQFRLNERLLAEGGEEAVHQARVALRRLRTAMKAFKAILDDDDAFGPLQGELKWLAAAFGEVRDLDVLLGRCSDSALRRQLAEARAAAFSMLLANLASSRARSAMLELSAWLACGDWRESAATRKARKRPLEEFAVDVLDALLRKVRKGGRDLVQLDDETRHEVRKDAKTLRYCAQFFASLFDGKKQNRRRKPLLDALESLQDRLGALNDLVAVPAVLARVDVAEEKRVAFLSEIVEGDHSKLVEAAAQAYDVVIDSKRFWR